MGPSQRAENMPFSPIRKLAPLADEAKKRGVKVYHLNIGQPDIETPQCALDALKSFNEKILAYSPSEGRIELRQALSRYYDSYGISLSADEIIVTSGGSEALLFAFLACLNPSDEIIVPDPLYANYLSFAISAGVVVRSVPTRIEEGFCLPSINEFEKLINPKTKGILICNPNNPTGYLYSREELLRLREIVHKHKLFLFSDEVYREFCYSDKPYLSAMQLEGIEDNVILIDSVSKRYSECGIRIGCLCTKNKSIRGAVMKLCQARLSPPLLGQVIAENSIGVSKEYIKGIRDEYISRRDFLIEGLNKIEGVYSPMPMGAFYTIARLPVEDAEDFCMWCLRDFSYQGATVMLAPASGFYSLSSLGKNEVRIAYVLCREDLGKALQILEKALEKYRAIGI